MSSLIEILTSVFEQEKEDDVRSISFSAIAIGPELVTSSANIPDQKSFEEFKAIMDENLSNTFVDLFKQATTIDGVTMDISFSYNSSVVVLKLAGKKTKLKRENDTDWFGLNMAELTINSKDTPMNSRETLVERGIRYLKKKKIKSYSKEYIGNLLDFIKGEIDTLRERTRPETD